MELHLTEHKTIASSIPHKFSNDNLRSRAFASASSLLTRSFSRNDFLSCISSWSFWKTYAKEFYMGKGKHVPLIEWTNCKS